MRFSVDAHAIGLNLTGNEVYIRNLLWGFARLEPPAEFIAYVSADGAEAHVPPGFRIRRVSRTPHIRLALDLPRRLRRDRPALVHVQYTAPLGCPAPVVVTVHDVSFIEHPEFFRRARALQLRVTVRKTVRQAARVLTPSEFSRRAILKAFGLPEERVVVVPNGVSEEFRPRPAGPAAAEVARRYGIPAPFVLTVGDLQPRKNHEGLIRAFAELVRHHPALPHRLVIVGQDGWYGAHVRRAAARSGIGDRIYLPGFVSDEDLRLFYAACDIFVFPSLYEGFGLPILEAMACGRAVACSNTTAMPEVADAAAVLFDPRNPGEMMRAMRDLITDPELRAVRERLGLKRASRFSWSRAAEKTLEVYCAVGGARARGGAERAASVVHS
jgi:glycosyltransferase involved in cell wall biosynthesis